MLQQKIYSFLNLQDDADMPEEKTEEEGAEDTEGGEMEEELGDEAGEDFEE